MLINWPYVHMHMALCAIWSVHEQIFLWLRHLRFVSIEIRALFPLENDKYFWSHNSVLSVLLAYWTSQYCHNTSVNRYLLHHMLSTAAEMGKYFGTILAAVKQALNEYGWLDTNTKHAKWLQRTWLMLLEGYLVADPVVEILSLS